jgi:tetratricopeptide (TPR) repeat protein
MKKTILLFLLILNIAVAEAQTQLTLPESSQKAVIMQRIGLTDITITYHSPLAKGRKIWGDLVPYNEVWRAGANENTTISFTTDIKIEGQALAAGTYGLHMIPTEKEWTIIFSRDHSAWGSYFYKENQDALRVKTGAKVINNQDWLSYNFTDLQPQSVIAELRWEKLSVPFKIEIDVPETVVQSMRMELTGLNGFFWQGYNQAAAYCVRNNVHLDEAAVWADRSVEIQKNFSNLTTKARLLEKKGNQKEAEALRKEALERADEAQINTYGYELFGEGKVKEAIEIFQLNVKKYPSSWNTYDSLGEAQQAAGDKKNALANYKTALSKAPENQKKRIEGVIAKLQ